MEKLGLNKFDPMEEKCMIKVLAIDDEEKNFRIGDLAQILEDYIKQDNDTEEMKLEDLDKVSMVLLLALAEFISNENITLSKLFGSNIYKQPVQIDENEYQLDIINSDKFFEVLNNIGIETNETEHENLKLFLAIDPSYIDKFSLDKLKSTIEEFTKNEEIRGKAKEYYKELIDSNQVQEEDDSNNERKLT